MAVDTSTELSQVDSATRWDHLRTFSLLFVRPQDLSPKPSRTDQHTSQAVKSLFFCECMVLVGGGTFAQQVAAEIGGARLTSWPSLVVIIFTVALAAPLCQAAD